MRIVVFCIFLLVLSGCQASQPTKNAESSGIGILGLIFGVTQDEHRNVTSVRLSRVEDVGSKSTIDYKLSSHLSDKATQELTEIWSGKETEYSPGTEFFVICIYTNIDPDNVGCKRGK